MERNDVYRRGYARFLQLYPRSYHERFGPEMEQMFHDLLREQRDGPVLGIVLRVLTDTMIGIIHENTSTLFMRTRNILAIVLGTASLLMIPLIAMQFSDDVMWTSFDFIVAGTLLLGTGLAYEFIASRSSDAMYRVGVGLSVMTGLMLIWVNLAVGLIGSEDNPANALYLGVIAIGVVGSIVARFEARRLVYVLAATAVAQALVPAIAFLIWSPDMSLGVLKVFVLNGFFVAMFAGAALMFRNVGLMRSRVS